MRFALESWVFSTEKKNIKNHVLGSLNHPNPFPKIQHPPPYKTPLLHPQIHRHTMQTCTNPQVELKVVVLPNFFTLWSHIHSRDQFFSGEYQKVYIAAF